MLDDLRNSAASSYEETIPPEVDNRRTKKKRARGPFLGMTSVQRFVVVLMLFILVIILGTLCLLLSGRVVPF